MPNLADDRPPPGGAAPETDREARAVAQVCGGLAHHFNNLLTVLRGNLHLLAMDQAVLESADLRELVAAIRSAADEAALTARGLSLIAGTVTAAHQSIDVNALLRRQVARFATFLGRRIDIRLALADGLPPVRIDPTDLESALQALVLNARDAIPQDGTLTVTTRRCAEPMAAEGGTRVDAICIDVADTGRGMTPAELAAAPQLLHTSRSRGKSAGLGLTMAQRAVEGAGGALHLASTPDHGTTVTIVLPVAAEDAA